MSEAASYIVSVVFDELGLTQEEAIDILAETIIEVADGDSRQLERAAEIIAGA